MRMTQGCVCVCLMLSCVARAATNVFEMPLIYPKHVQLQQQMAQAVRAGKIDEMEAACRAGVELLPRDPTWGQFTEAILIARRTGEVHWRDIAAGFDDWATFQAGRGSNCQLFRSTSEKRARFVGMTMADGVRWFWNNPTAGSSPYQMFSGVLRPDRLDEEGDVIYAYDPTRT